MALTDAQIRSFKPKIRRVRKSDGGGLFVDMMPSGRKVFRLAYRFQGKQRTVVVGEYPRVKLAEARLKASEYKLSLREGKDPHTLTAPAVSVSEASQGPTWCEVAND